jgi:heat shock protein HslJ
MATYKKGVEMFKDAISEKNCEMIVEDIMGQVNESKPEWDFEKEKFVMDESRIDCTQMLELDENGRVVIGEKYKEILNRMLGEYELKLGEFKIKDMGEHPQTTHMTEMNISVVHDRLDHFIIPSEYNR